MKKDNKVFLLHILECIKLIEKYTKGLSEKNFLSSKEKQDSVLRRLEIIGEAARNLPARFKGGHKQIEWSKAIAIRNILIHHYFEVDNKIVWDTVKINLPKLKQQILDLLD